MKLRHATVLLLLLAACDRPPRPEAASAPAAAPALSAWSWHPLGGLAVVEGEVPAPTELVLEGPSILEHRFAERGPVRWEFFRPPPGESAVLRTADGRVLARFEFSLQTDRPRARAEARRGPPPVPALPGGLAGPSAEASRRRPSPPSAAQPEPPLPTVRADVRLRNLPVAPIRDRAAVVLPSPALAATLTRRVSPHVPVLVNPEPPRPASPVPPPVALATPITLTPIPFKGDALAWPGMGEALNLTRGPGGRKRMLLSFDGGSSAEVAAEVLDLLKARGVRTTFFLTGAFIQRYPAIVKRMAAEGHEIGNHTMHHPHFAPGMKRDPKWTKERVQRELLEADAALVHLLGRPMDPFWRAPYGEHTAEIRRWAEELGYRHVGWSEGADTLDWATTKDRRLYRTGVAIVARLQQRLGRDGDGLIVLMHLGSERELGDRPTQGLGAFMDRARNEGWTFVSAGTILHDLGKPVWDPHQRLALLKGTPAPGR